MCTKLQAYINQHYTFQNQGEDVPGEVLHSILKELDTNRNGQVEIEEYLAVRNDFFYCHFFHMHDNIAKNSIIIKLQMMSAIKSGAVVNSRFARMAEMEEERLRLLRTKITVDRSGGGL